MKSSVQPALLYHPPTQRLVMRLRPSTLLGAMWLQLAEAVAGGDTVRECASCKKWFQVNVGEDARKAKRKFCSTLCKLHDYRRRQAAAASMAAAGQKPRQIAKELGTDLKNRDRVGRKETQTRRMTWLESAEAVVRVGCFNGRTASGRRR